MNRQQEHRRERNGKRARRATEHPDGGGDHVCCRHGSPYPTVLTYAI